MLVVNCPSSIQTLILTQESFPQGFGGPLHTILSINLEILGKVLKTLDEKEHQRKMLYAGMCGRHFLKCGNARKRQNNGLFLQVKRKREMLLPWHFIDQELLPINVSTQTDCNLKKG